MSEKQEVEVEKSYSKQAIANKLKRIAQALENDESFEMQIAHNRFTVSKNVEIEFEYEHEEGEHELEIEFKWKN